MFVSTYIYIYIYILGIKTVQSPFSLKILIINVSQSNKLNSFQFLSTKMFNLTNAYILIQCFCVFNTFSSAFPFFLETMRHSSPHSCWIASFLPHVLLLFVCWSTIPFSQLFPLLFLLVSCLCNFQIIRTCESYQNLFLSCLPSFTGN